MDETTFSSPSQLFRRMKKSGFTQQFRPVSSKYRLAWAFLTLASLFFVQNLWGQGGPCSQITFSFEHYEPCKFRARYQNDADCYTEVRYLLESGTFESWNVNAAAGFTVDVISPSELWVHHVNGFFPLGNQAPLLFTLPTDLNTTMYVAYLDDCFQVGCEVFGGFPIESCPDPMDASIIGTKYRECGSLPFLNQPTIPNWTIQLLDEMGNVIAEQQTDSEGRYAIYDLPKGQYIVREIAAPGWTPKVPVSGEYLVDLNPSQQVVRNFGNCPSCSCDDVYFDVVQVPDTSGICEYGLSVTNTGAYCFDAINLSLSAGAFDEVIPADGWDVVVIDSQHVRLVAIDDWTQFVFHRWRPKNASMFEMTVSTSYNVGQGNVVCERVFGLECPPPVIPRTCCPLGTTPGPELVQNGNFESGNTGFTNSYIYIAPGIQMPVGRYSVLNASEVYTANNQWACTDHTASSPTGKMLVVDGFGGPIAWQQPVSVTAGTRYVFSAWFNNLVRPPKDFADPQVVLFVDNTQIAGPLTLPEIPDRWVQLCDSFYAPVTGTVMLSIQMLSTATIGNDVAIDDVSFRACAPLPSCICPPNAYTNMSYKQSSGPNVPISCGEVAIWQCQFPVFNLGGDFMCQGNNCPAMPNMFWTLTHPNLGQVDSDVMSGTGFQVSIPNASFPLPGLYTLTLAGICGEDTCYCEILIETPGCGSGCTADFSADFVACDKYNFFGFANGTPSFTFNWNFGDPNSGTNNTSNLQNPMHQFSGPGAYTVTLVVIDAVGCTATYSTTITVPVHPTTVTITGNLGICTGQSTTLTTSGGQWTTCLWSNSGSGTSIQVSAPGTYCVTCTDVNGCTATGCASVTQHPVPTVSISGPTAICDEAGATFTANAPTGSTYLWSIGNFTTQNITVNPPSPGVYSYTVTATSVNGCTATASVTLTVLPLPNANAGTNQLICIGQTAVLTASGGVSYQWSPNGSTANPYVTPSVLANTTYTVTVTNAQGCTATATVTVTVKLCDCETNPFVQNGEFNLGNPCAQGDEDICNATNWCSIWPDYAGGVSTGDFFNTITCTPTALPLGALATPTPGSGLNGNFAGFWCKPHNQRVWREGILNNLSAPILPNSGNYMFSMKMACLTGVTGTPRVSVYGVPAGAVSTVPTPNPLTGFTPTNVDLFNSGGAIRLGTIPVPSGCNNTYQDVGFSFNTATLGQPINRVFLTRDDPVGNDWGGTTYLAVDSVCLKPVPNLASCECGQLNWATIQQEWTPPQPISCNGAFVPVPCRIQGANYFIHGDFTCQPDFCGNNTVTWVLTRPSPLPPVSGSTSLSAYPHFDISLPAAYFTVSGNYSLTITRACGITPCHCKLNFKIEACPCLCDQAFADQVALGFSMGNSFFPPNQCAKKLKPISLCPNDMVAWTVPGVGTFTSTGNAPVTVNFPVSGTYFVCMIVQRTDANGNICTREFCRTIIVKCGIGPLDPITDVCLETKVKNSGFNEGNVPGVLNEVGAIAEWELAPNPGDGLVVVVDSTGSLNDGHIVLVGRKDNFAGIMQEVNFVPDNYLTLKFEAINYLGSESPEGTRLEIRLQEEAISYPGMAKQVLLLQEIQDSSGWRRLGATLPGNIDTSLHYLVICLQNDDGTPSIVGVDNIEICSSEFTGTEEGVDGLQGRMRIFPNPNAGTFEVALQHPTPKNSTFRITDLTGRSLLVQPAEPGSSRQTLRAYALPNGLYFLQVVSEGRVIAVERFVKQ